MYRLVDFSRKAVVAFVMALLVVAEANAQRSEVAGDTYRGHSVQIDLPITKHVKNGRAAGVGKCVFATLKMQGYWANEPGVCEIFDEVRVGGGWPAKVDALMAKHAPNVPYWQYEGNDLRHLDKALQSGRPAGVTYGYSPRYTTPISHMVLLVYLDQELACVIDNNYPGTYEWMSRAEFQRRWVHTGGRGWAIVLLSPPPPPVPHN